MLKPVFSFIQDVKHISFEDDIILLLKSLIRKSKSVSEINWQMFDLFPNVVAKNKGALGDLLDTLNTYLFYGK